MESPPVPRLSSRPPIRPHRPEMDVRPAAKPAPAVTAAVVPDPSHAPVVAPTTLPVRPAPAEPAAAHRLPVGDAAKPAAAPKQQPGPRPRNAQYAPTGVITVAAVVMIVLAGLAVAAYITANK